MTLAPVDAALREVAMAQPESIEGLSRRNGVGVRKLEAYGEDILQRVVAQA